MHTTDTPFEVITMTQPIIEQVYEALVRYTSISSKSLTNSLKERPWVKDGRVVPNALMRLKQQGRATNTTDPETGVTYWAAVVGEDIDVLGVVKGGDAEAPVVNESLTTEPPTGPAQPDPAQNPRAMPAHASTISAVTDAVTAFSEKYPGGDFAMFRVFCDGMAYAKITKS